MQAAQPAKPGNFYARSMRTSLVLGALALPFAFVYAGLRPAWAYGLAWGWVLCNFALWQIGLREFFSRRRPLPMIVLGSAKVAWLAVLMGLAAGARISEPGNFLAFLLGLGTPFLVMLLKSLGSLIAGPNEAPAPKAQQQGEAMREND